MAYASHKVLPVLPPNHVSHMVRYYEHLSKNAPQPVGWEIASWILFQGRAKAYANTMVMPGRFNII
jgi:hypothetical protein